MASKIGRIGVLPLKEPAAKKPLTAKREDEIRDFMERVKEEAGDLGVEVLIIGADRDEVRTFLEGGQPMDRQPEQFLEVGCWPAWANHLAQTFDFRDFWGGPPPSDNGEPQA
jgi:hypothetical protein